MNHSISFRSFRSIAFIFLFFLAKSLLAQQTKPYIHPWKVAKGDVTRMYPISNAEARDIFVEEKMPDTTWLERAFVPDQQPLSWGNYLGVNIEGEVQKLSVVTNVWFMPQLLNTRHDLAFTIIDTLGRPIEDAICHIRGKRVPFDKKTQCYRLKKWKKTGVLEIELNGTAAFYSVQQQRDNNNYYINGIRVSGHAYPNRFKQCYKQWRRRTQMADSGKEKIAAFFGFENKGRSTRQGSYWSGYHAFSQPKYRPRDTMQVKFWLTDEKGKPWERPIQLDVFQAQGNKIVKNARLTPTRPGVFTYAFGLNDSLTLDQDYILKLTAYVRTRKPFFKKKKHFKTYSYATTFRYEDYVLDELVYTFKSERNIYYKADTVRFTLEAQTTNQQAVPDGNYKLVVETQALNGFSAPEVYVPDTIWRTEGNLDVSGRTELVLPPQLRPNADLTLLAKTYFTNSSGELKVKEVPLAVLHTPPPAEQKGLKANIANGILTAKAIDPALNNKKIILRVMMAGKSRDTAVTLPFSMRVRPEMQAFDFYDGLILLAQISNTEPDQVRARSMRGGDKAGFEIGNPWQLAIQYRIFKENKLIEEGMTRDSQFVWMAPSVRSDYSLFYTYTWGGETRHNTQIIDFKEKLLNVDLKTPTSVEPGETAQITVQVLDSHQKPAANVELTAGGYNARFGQVKSPFTIPQITVKPSKKPNIGPVWEWLSPVAVPLSSLPITERAYRDFGLGTIPFYQLRDIGPVGQSGLPQAIAMNMPLDSFRKKNETRVPSKILSREEERVAECNDERPQFAPFIILHGRAEPIYMIWHNERLVYYYGASQQQNYSFFGNEGSGNNIRLRTRDGEYALHGVNLQRGQKTILAFYGEGWLSTFLPVSPKRNIVSKHALSMASLRWEPRPDTLTVQEQWSLSRNMLQVRNARYGDYFWNRADNLHLFNGSNRGKIVLGPFEAYSKLSRHNHVDGRVNFQFEPGFEYHIDKNRDRLFASNWPSRLGKLPAISAVHKIATVANSLQGLPAPIPKLDGYYRYSMEYYNKIVKKGSLQLQIKTDSSVVGFTLSSPIQLYGLFEVHKSVVNGIEPGIYTLTLFAASGLIASRTISIKGDTTLGLIWDKPLFAPAKHDSLRLDSFFQKQNRLVEKNESILCGTSSNSKPYIEVQSTATERHVYISGNVFDPDTDEDLIGASVKIFFQGRFLRGAVTDVSGEFRIPFPVIEELKNMANTEGIKLDIEISYVGYKTQFFAQSIPYRPNSWVRIRVAIIAEAILHAIEIADYTVPLISVYQTSAGQTLTSEEIRNLPTRDIYSQSQFRRPLGDYGGTVSGVVSIKGSRSNATTYYIDGIRVPNGESLAEDYFDQGPLPPGLLRTNFSDLAYFQPTLRTDDRGMATFSVKFPDDITAWEQFAIATDAKGRGGHARARTRALKSVTAQVNVPRFAIAGDVFDISGRATNSTDDSLLVRTRFLFNKKILKEKTTKIGFGMAEFQRVDIPANTTDSAFFTYELQSGNSRDGEMRGIPVLPAGIEEAQGNYTYIARDTAIEWTFDPTKGPVTVVAERSMLNLLIKDIEYLRQYPYGCNEQLSSKLRGMLVLKKIYTWQKKPIDFEDYILTAIKTLSERQAPDGTWGWWSGDKHNWWMTLYVTQTLQQAKVAGYTVHALDKILPLLRIQLPNMGWNEQLIALDILKKSGSDVHCVPYLAKADSLIAETRGEQPEYWLQALQLQQLCGKRPNKAHLKRILTPTYGGLHVKGELYHWYYRTPQLTLQAYRIAQAAGWTELSDSIGVFWLHNRTPHYTTFDKAQIVEALIPDLLRYNETGIIPQLTINGKHCTDERCTLTLPPDQPIRLEKSGAGGIFVNAYQTFLNPAPAPRTVDYVVNTELHRNASSVPTTVLKYGEAATLVVHVEAIAGSDYVMIEVPIPAGCTYGPKTNRRNYHEVHREYFKDRTAIFCAHLPKGGHTFEIPLETRFKGKFTLNPAKAERMYFPVFYGRNEIGTVESED
jgi:alpha-2-macroglobulin